MGATKRCRVGAVVVRVSLTVFAAAAACGGDGAGRGGDAQLASTDADNRSTDAQASDALIQSTDAQPADAGTYGTCSDGYRAPVSVFELGNDHPAELSGIAISRKNPGVLWVHDDGDNEPWIYAMNMNGVILGHIELAPPISYPPFPPSPANFHFNNDWEDCAIGPCPSGDCIYVGDIGDNDAAKQESNPGFHYTIYQVPEPAVDPNTPFGVITSEQWVGFPFLYPDKSHNSEALAVSPGGRVYVFSKEANGEKTAIFRFPDLPTVPPRQFTPAPDVLIAEGELELPFGPLSTLTGAAIHPQGDRLALRTYVDLFEYAIGSDGTWGAATRTFELPQLSYPLESPQGEAVDYDPVTGHLFTISERPASGLLGTAALHEFACE
jgi:hypothetical protein